MKKFQFAQFDTATDIAEVQLMRAGMFDYWGDGSKLELTADLFRKFKANFDARILGVDIAIDYFHNAYNEAAGWIKAINLKENDTQLWVVVDWTPAAREKIMAKEIRYLSADFHMDWKNPETGNKHGPTLLGGGLTNRPFLKGMNPILDGRFDRIRDQPEDDSNSSQRKKGMKMDFNEVKQAAIILNDAEKKELGALLGLEQKDVKLSEEVVTLRTQLAAKEAETKQLNEKLATQAKEAEFAVLLSEGKAVEAQKDAYLKGDVAAFTKLAVPVNLTAAGTGAPRLEDKPGAEPKTAEEADAKILTLAEEKVKADTKLSISDAMRVVMQEKPELAKLAGRA